MCCLINSNSWSQGCLCSVPFWTPTCFFKGKPCPIELLPMSIAAESWTHRIPLQMPPQTCPSFPVSWQVCVKTAKIILITCNTYKIGKWIVNLHCHFHLTKTEITWNVIFSGLFPSLNVPACVWWISVISLFSRDSWQWVKAGEITLDKRRCIFTYIVHFLNPLWIRRSVYRQW